MKIENQIITIKESFKKSVELKRLMLSTLQYQYLAELQMGTTIYDLVTNTARRGWLVNFRELYGLIYELVKGQHIENEEFYNYFNLIHLAENRPATQIIGTKHMAQIETHAGLDKRTEKLVREAHFFRSIEPDLLNELLTDSQTIRVKPDQAICTENSGDRDLYYLIEGQLAVFKTVGKSKKFVSLIEPGAVFGETAFFLNHPRTADVVALKSSVAVQIPFRSEFMSECLNQQKAASIVQRFWVQHALIHSELFKKLPADCFDSLANVGTIAEFKNQAVVFSQNDIGGKAYCVIQGSLVVLQNNKKIQTLSQGSLFGEIALIVSGGRRTATVVCTSDVVLLEITQLSFYQLLASNLYLANQIQSIAEDRIKQDSFRKAS